MEQVVIILIAAIFVGLRAVVEKLKGAEKDAPTRTPPPSRSLSSGPVQLTEADRRYREVQEEIRRRIALRQGQASSQPVAPAKTKIRRAETQTANYPAPAPVAPPSVSPAYSTSAAMPVASTASTMEAAATEAAAYALPAGIMSDSPARSTPASASMRSLRALLASPASARQAYLLREILDRPLSLHPAERGGHQSWS